ncbi:MAG: hypothetical protein HQ478_02775 [Chloroflexi bacterium]|nr:hypothetical protein [Chloroflexota bacterium]
MAVQTARLVQRLMVVSVLLVAMALVIACSSDAGELLLPTFASPPTTTPIPAVPDSPRASPRQLSPDGATEPTVARESVRTVVVTEKGADSDSDETPVVAREPNLSRATPYPTPIVPLEPVVVRFSQEEVALENVGDTAIIRLEADGIFPAANGFQLNIMHADSVVIRSISCLGIFEGAFVVGPVPMDGGSLFGCVILGGTVGVTGGAISEINLERIAAGTADLVILEAAVSGEAFDSYFVGLDEVYGLYEQDIEGANSLMVTD